MNQDLHCSHGRVSSMPGSSHSLPEGTMCDDHPDRPAVKRIQGETDSFGCEYICMCQECADKHAAYRKELNGGDHIGSCSCGNRDVPLFAKRDWEEGNSGPVYYKCRACVDAWNIREAKELEESQDTSDPYDDYFD